MANTGKISDFKLETKQMIHIAAEIVVLIGLVFYISSKNKKLQGHIEELSQRAEDQEDRIRKLEAVIQKMSSYIDNLGTGFSNLANKVSSMGTTERKEEVVKPKHVRPFVQEVDTPKPSPKVKINEKENKVQQPPSPSKDEESETESDLDDEIREELDELLEDESSLKKEN